MLKGGIVYRILNFYIYKQCKFMILDNIKNRYPKLPYILFSLMILVFISKSYAFYIFEVNMGSSIPNEINFILVWGFRICLGLLILFTTWNLDNIFFIAIGFLVTILYRESSLLAFVVLGVYCRDNKISTNYIVKTYLYITAVFFLGSILLNTFKIIPNSANVHFRNNSIRNDFGLGNPNAPFLAALPMYAGYIYLRFDKYDNIDRILLILISLLIYSQTFSRTGLITIFTILIFVELIKRVDITKNKYARFVLSYLPILITLFSFLTAKLLNFKFFNKLLSERPRLWDIYTGHIKLFRNVDYFSLRENYPLDNSYIFSFVLYGIIFTILLLFIYTYFMKQNVIKNNSKVLAISSLFLIYSYGENILLRTYLNFTFILVIITICSNFSIKNIKFNKK